MSVLIRPEFPLVAGEEPIARIVRIVQFYAGCSLSARRDELAALVGRGVDDESLVEAHTNCLTFIFGVLVAAGCVYPSLCIRWDRDLAGGRLLAFAKAKKALVTDGSPPIVGSVMHYERVGNDDHWEVELPNGQHGGGGRDNNLIAIDPVGGDWHYSEGRPIRYWIDPTKLGIPVLQAPDAGQPAADLHG
jgi:hypothetical protein